MANYSKTDLVKDVAAKLNHSQPEVKELVDAVFTQIQERAAAGDKVSFIGFGSFVQKETAARQGRNPRTGEPVEIPAGSRLTFKASKTK